MNQYRDIQFVNDHPSSSDEFKGQPHKRVADALVSILTSGVGGRAIGLEGAWGSGKSTVVDIAQSALKSNNGSSDEQNFTFFVFDAWAHQSDPLRRVFLQELIQCLDDNNAVNEDYWGKQLEILETSRKVVTENKAEKLSLVAKASLVIVPLLPVAYHFISKDSATFTIDIPFLGCFFIPFWIVGAAILAIPFLAAFFTLISWREGWIKGSLNIFARSWWRRTEDKKGKSIIWAFTKQTDQVTTEQFIKEEEATTVEFNEKFDELIEDAANHNHRVVIVFDNMDRLPAELIQSTWATMRNFFATTPGSSREKALQNVWLIVPFDRTHIESVFDKNTADEEADATPGFIEKTFEIVLRVSPPILSNWKGFLGDKLGEAFGTAVSGVQIFQVFKVFDLFYKDAPEKITPRTIKAFINAIVAHAKQWGGVIPLEHLALYALYKSKISQAVSSLQSSTLFPSDLEQQLTNPDWTKSLAAAHYNVDPDDAIEVLLRPEIDKAFQNQQPEALERIAATSGFEELLHDFVARTCAEQATMHPNTIFNMAAILSDFELLDSVIQDDIWRRLIVSVANFRTPILVAERSSVGYSALITHAHSDQKVDLAKHLLRILSVPHKEEPTKATAEGRVWYKHFLEIANALPDKVYDNEFENIFANIPIRANVEYVNAIAAATTEKVPFSCFKPKSSPTDIAGSLAEQANEPSPSDEFYSCVRAYLQKPDCVGWGSVSNTIQARLQSSSIELAAADAYRLLTCLVKIADINKTGQESLNALNDDSTLHGLIGLAQTESDFELEAQCYHELMAFREGALTGSDDHPTHGDLASVNASITQVQTAPQDHEKLIKRLAELAVSDGRFSDIFSSAMEDNGNAEFYASILREIVRSGEFGSLQPYATLISMSELSNILGAELLKTFLHKFDDYNISRHINGDQWEGIAPQYFTLAKPESTSHYPYIVKVVSDGLASFPKDRWIEGLQKEDNTLHLLFTLNELGETVELNDNFYDALTEHTLSFVEGGSMPSKFRPQWHRLTSFLSSNRLIQFSKTLRDFVINNAPSHKVLRGVFNLFGSEVLEKGEYPEKSDEVIRIILDPLLSVSYFSVIEKHAKTFSSVLKAASQEDEETIDDRLMQLHRDADEEGQQEITKLANALGRKLEFPEPEGEGDEDNDEEPTTPP